MNQITFDVEALLECGTFENEIDALLETLPQIAPPADFVARVMGAVATLPTHTSPISTPWGDLDQMIVLTERDRLS